MIERGGARRAPVVAGLAAIVAGLAAPLAGLAALAAGLAAPVVGLAASVAVLAMLASPGSVAAQVPDSTALPDSARLRPDSAQLRLDSLQQAPDSAQLRIMERLRLLSRPPGYDSVLYVQDSVRLAEAEQGIRPGATAAGDSVTRALVSIPGYSLTEYDGARADFQARDRVLVLRAGEDARARVSREGMSVEADTSITFDQTSGRLRTVGAATFTPPEGDAVESANLVYDMNQGRGSALDATTSYNQAGATWLVRGDMPYAAQDSSFMSHARFTSCDLEEPHYHFETDEIKIVGGNVLVARGVRLYFADVPVAWLPFIAQSLSSGRSSGLLTPSFSVNDIVRTSGGYRRRVSNVGFYWAMSDYSDASVAMDWFSGTHFALTGTSRYAFNRHFLNGDLSYRRYWRESGSAERTFDTRHAWQPDERTNLSVSARYSSSTDLIRETSYDPREVTQSIDSEGGLQRRFGWGMMSVAANRQQYLSDDRTTWLLPQVNLSLTPVTLFNAPPTEASFYNNMTWSGSAGFSRKTLNRAQPDTFSFALADNLTNQANARSTLRLGGLSFSQSADITESRTLEVPEALLLLGDSASPGGLLTGAPARDIARADLGWSSSVSYQQRLIGSTTLTPNLSVRGRMVREDTSSIARSFVSGPTRVSLGATLKTDIYGFYPGFGPYEAVRHKASPSFTYQWTPEASPSELQRQVFGSAAIQPVQTLEVGFNQTWEAKRAVTEEDTATATDGDLGVEPAAELEPGVEPEPGVGAGQPGAGGAQAGVGGAQPGVGGAQASIGGADEPQRLPQAQTVKLLGLNTSVVRYDFVVADSVGSLLGGFQTTQLSNTVTSDLLRGLSFSFAHDLFDDTLDEDRRLVGRRFAPHLSSMNFSFSLGSRSAIVRFLGLGGGDEDAEGDELDETEPTEPFDAEGLTDEGAVIPTATPGRLVQPTERRSAVGTWSAQIRYSLLRPRDDEARVNQMLSGSLTLQPTVNWSVSWRTSYDLEAGAFNDHTVRLTRDLHRWQANFDFRQTATGNWSFRFEVSLLDNRDLKFDYSQRNLELGLPASQR